MDGPLPRNWHEPLWREFWPGFRSSSRSNGSNDIRHGYDGMKHDEFVIGGAMRERAADEGAQRPVGG
jgi:hypothetical protein